MKFTIEKETLFNTLSKIQGAVEKRHTIPILQNVKLEAKDGKIHLTATDMDIVVTSTVAANVDAEGVTTVPAQLFHDIVRKIPDGSQIEIDLNDKGDSLTIKYGKSKFKLPCLVATDFPVITEGDADKVLKISANSLIMIIDKSRFAISTDETRYYLNGIYFHSRSVGGDLELRGVTTDGHRLALVKIDAPKDLPEISGVIIPRKTINEIRRILEGVDGEIEISLSKAKIKVTIGDTVLISKLIDGDFPDYDRVIPTDNNEIVRVNKKLLSQAIDRVSTITTDKHRSIKLVVADNSITISATANEGSTGDEKIEAKYSGSAIEAGFNSRYLLDILMQIDKEEVILKFKEGGSPAIVQGEGDDSALFVIMPVRI